jgi:GNAT superfamily N-acetyltransferase
MPAMIRRALPADAAVCGPICFEAFRTINAQHNYAPEIPSNEVAAGLLGMLFSHPGFYNLVAEVDGRVVGSNCLDERTPIAGVGPITVDPSAQNRGVGRMLMDGIIERAQEAGFAGVRLVQAAFHARSLSLYTKLGFQTREPLALMRGAALGWARSGYAVRPAVMDDLEACNRVCSRVHGHDRGGRVARRNWPGDGDGGGAGGPGDRLCNRGWVLRAHGGRDSGGFAGADWRGAGVCGGGDFGADAERGVVPMVPGERVASDSADDLNVSGPVPRT